MVPKVSVPCIAALATNVGPSSTPFAMSTGISIGKPTELRDISRDPIFFSPGPAEADPILICINIYLLLLKFIYWKIMKTNAFYFLILAKTLLPCNLIFLLGFAIVIIAKKIRIKATNQKVLRDKNTGTRSGIEFDEKLGD